MTSSLTVSFMDDVGAALHYSGACLGEMSIREVTPEEVSKPATEVTPPKEVTLSLFDRTFVEAI